MWMATGLGGRPQLEHMILLFVCSKREIVVEIAD